VRAAYWTRVGRIGVNALRRWVAPPPSVDDEVSLIPARQGFAAGKTVGPCAMLAVSDTGHGMSEATPRKIFLPLTVGEGAKTS
jgi:hypothetical protein